MAVITALVLTMGKSFAEGAMTTIGAAAASLLIPVLMPKLMGAVKAHANKASSEEETDPDLC